MAKHMIKLLLSSYLLILLEWRVPDARQILPTVTYRKQATLVPPFTLPNLSALSNLAPTSVQALQAL